MTGTPEFDAAILHVVNQQRLEAGQEPISKLGHIVETKKFLVGIIAKLIDGMEPNDAPAMVTAAPHTWQSYLFGFNAALTEIRRRAGLEVES
jgi:hypothetical protein